jgi:hypothetical protein
MVAVADVLAVSSSACGLIGTIFGLALSPNEGRALAENAVLGFSCGVIVGTALGLVGWVVYALASA